MLGDIVSTGSREDVVEFGKLDGGMGVGEAIKEKLAMVVDVEEATLITVTTSASAHNPYRP